jgi:hypothetical protein
MANYLKPPTNKEKRIFKDVKVLSKKTNNTKVDKAKKKGRLIGLDLDFQELKERNIYTFLKTSFNSTRLKFIQRMKNHFFSCCVLVFHLYSTTYNSNEKKRFLCLTILVIKMMLYLWDV